MAVYVDGKEVSTKLIEPLPIDKGLPIPPTLINFERHSALMATARAMEVGDSVEIDYERSPLASNMARATGFKFTQRKLGNKLRIWRIK